MHAPATKARWRASRVRTAARAAGEPVIRTAWARRAPGHVRQAGVLPAPPARSDEARPLPLPSVPAAAVADHQPWRAASNRELNSSLPAERGDSLVTRCCGMVPSTSRGMSEAV